MFRRLSPTESVALLIWQEPRMPKALDVICSKDSTAKSPAGDIKTEGKCITGYISFISVCFRCYYLTSQIFVSFFPLIHIFFHNTRFQNNENFLPVIYYGYIFEIIFEKIFCQIKSFFDSIIIYTKNITYKNYCIIVSDH